ncbi:MAG: MFS transporter [Deltaproteobacteria bacterium]|nr:MFS transporter [Deltaproteobacteria bacterium]
MIVMIWKKSTAFIHGVGSERVKLLGFVTIGHFFIHWFQQFYPVVLPSLKTGLGLNDVQVGALNSARQFTMGALDLPLGMLADAVGRHRALILASAIVSMGAAYLLMGIAPYFFWAIVGSALVGLGTSLWHPAATASLSNKFPERRATALAVHGMGATVGDTLTPLGVGFLLVTFPWDTTLQMQIVPALLLGFLVWRGLAGFFENADSHPSRAGQIREIVNLARNPLFIWLSVSIGLFQMGRLVVQTFLPIYLQEHLGYSPLVLGFYIALQHAMGTVSQPILGFLSDRFGRKATLFPSFIALGVLFALIAVVQPGIQLGLVISAIGLFFYTLLNVVIATVMDVADPKIQASSYGLTSLVTHLVVFPSPMLAGLLVGSYGIGSTFWFAGALVILGAFVLAPLRLYKGTRKG